LIEFPSTLKHEDELKIVLMMLQNAGIVNEVEVKYLLQKLSERHEDLNSKIESMKLFLNQPELGMIFTRTVANKSEEFI
jgi:hypothetical protein